MNARRTLSAGILLAGFLAACSGQVAECASDATCSADSRCVAGKCVAKPRGACGAVDCSAEQRCNDALECVADLPPTLSLTSLSNGAVAIRGAPGLVYAETNGDVRFIAP